MSFFKYFLVPLFLLVLQNLWSQNTEAIMVPFAKYVEWPGSWASSGKITLGLGYDKKIKDKWGLRAIGWKRLGNYGWGGTGSVGGAMNNLNLKFGVNYYLLQKQKWNVLIGLHYNYEKIEVENGSYISDAGPIVARPWNTKEEFNAAEFYYELERKIYTNYWLYLNSAIQMGAYSSIDNMFGERRGMRLRFPFIENIGMKYKF